jgi:uncharacterized protein (DUF2237 family)
VPFRHNGEMDDSINVFGEPLEPCGTDPVTGYFRDGYCNTSDQDAGSHTVCARVTEEFLAFSGSRGNDLVTPRPEFGFPGLRPGDQWCLCATRWLEAERQGAAPKIVLKATHQRALERIDLATLCAHAIDLN